MGPGRCRLSVWAERGLLPQGVTPCTIAAAYVRATGQQPARDPERRATRIYSALELLQALAQLGPGFRLAPPAPPFRRTFARMAQQKRQGEAGR